MSSLYIHIPFCKSKCHYCAFNSYPNLEYLFERYQRAIRTELNNIRVETPFKTIFFGGGTPTVFGAERLADLLALTTTEVIDQAAEITVEANPETIDPAGFTILKQAGVNRISFGIQSFNSDDLACLGRAHSVERAVEAISEAKSTGFDNISLDLMSALPGQTVSAWRKILTKALDLAPKHLSIYQLTPEEDTRFYELYVSEKVFLPDDQASAEIDQITAELCAERGLGQYEISNYALANYRCLHNINYWQNNDYYAAGAGAVSCLNGCRERRVNSPEDYCQRIESKESVIIERETLDRESSFRETVIIGLRMVAGVSVERLKERYAIDPVSYYGKTFSDLQNKDLLEIKDGYMRITDLGRPLSNNIMAELV